MIPQLPSRTGSNLCAAPSSATVPPIAIHQFHSPIPRGAAPLEPVEFEVPVPPDVPPALPLPEDPTGSLGGTPTVLLEVALEDVPVEVPDVVEVESVLAELEDSAWRWFGEE
ncbi:hypothetical protein Tdes44962_MAKER06111 [Teratosphaeria destructans]|uniref:Uncharacterized protein n=1 Tax=Teratosphaeria destructans TaxID=418781 RepID=A0A9W7VXQ6_9PEZI|nr:hypothetical protein Tdes44962_MAKER06111 [Teratosphaeria destructans]